MRRASQRASPRIGRAGFEERKMKQTIIAMLAIVAAAGLLTVMPAGTSHAGDVGLEALIPQMATTPEQHKAVASYYRSEASAASAEAERHRQMGKSYSQGNYTRKKAMQEHCEKLSASYDALAKQYDELALEHEQAAAAK
jgi:hypothetical protein